jgi:hypothetical protein
VLYMGLKLVCGGFGLKVKKLGRVAGCFKDMVFFIVGITNTSARLLQTVVSGIPTIFDTRDIRDF